MYCFLWFVWTSQTDTLPGFKLRELFTILFEKWIRWLITISNSSATFVKRKEKFHLNGEAHWDRNYTPWQPAAWSPCFGSCAILPRPTALPDLASQPNSLGLIKAIFLLKTVTYFGTRLNESTYQNTSPKTLPIGQFMERSLSTE